MLASVSRDQNPCSISPASDIYQHLAIYKILGKYTKVRVYGSDNLHKPGSSQDFFFFFFFFFLLYIKIMFFSKKFIWV